MPALQNRDRWSSDTNAMDQLHDFLRQRREAHEPVEHLDAFAPERHRLFVPAAREALSQALARFGLDVPVGEGDGERYHRGLRGETTSTSAAGPVRVARSLYRPPQGGLTLGPRELRAGSIEGAWPPGAAQPATWAVAPLTPQAGEARLALLGHMTPAKRTLDRLPTALRVHWETPRLHCAATLRHQATIPVAAATLAVSLAGVRAPMQDGERQAQRTPAVAAGQPPSGPAGSQEVGGATGSYSERAGNRRLPRRMARMPETNKRTLKSQLPAEVLGALSQPPAGRGVTVAAGAADNWSSRGELLPFGEEGLDFYQAVTPLGDALGAAYGEGPLQSQARFATLREVLRDAPEGVDPGLGALGRLRTRSPRRQALHQALASCRAHRHRMRSGVLRAHNLPRGSGGVEAACQTLVSQRWKRAGMRWRTVGGQAMVTFRALCQSARCARAWCLLGETYKRSVRLPRHVIALSQRR
jgi:hypothetical protein